MKRALGGISVLTAVALAAQAGSEEIRVGVEQEITSMDPYFFLLTQNQAAHQHWIESLVLLDNFQKPVPRLAESWRVLPGQDKVWEFKLRRGVKFQDGAPFTADDILFTKQHADPKKSATPPGRYWENKEITKIDDYTLHITTGTAFPLMAKEVALVPVSSRKSGQGTTTEDYNSGKNVIGTGPYKFVEWVKADRLVFVRNPDYWGEKAQWDRVTYRPVKESAARVAALLSGSVDVINFVPPNDLPQLRRNSKVGISESPSNRVIYVVPDMSKDVSPYVKGNDGQPIPNPFRDMRVRKAVSLAIDRNAIVTRIMDDTATPAGQMAPDFVFGYNPDLKPDKYDPETAKRLLEQAGYPNGFRLTITGPTDRYVNGVEILEAMAQMLTRIGIKTEVLSMPTATYMTRLASGGEGRKPEFSLSLYSSGSNVADSGSQIQNSHHTPNVLPNMGRLNYSYYSNPVVDDLLVHSSQMVDEAQRLKMVREAHAIIMRDVAMIPLHYQKNIWAHRADLIYAGHVDEMTIADLIRKKK